MVKNIFSQYQHLSFGGQIGIKYYRRFNINENLWVSWHGFMKYKSHYSSQ